MINFSITKLEQGDIFDPSILASLAPFTQDTVYGDWQNSLGRKVMRFVISDDVGPVVYFQAVKYPLLFGKTYLYIPYGPIVKAYSEPLLIFLKIEIQKIARAENSVFVRLDFTPTVPVEMAKNLFTKSSRFTYHSAFFQPRVEWFVGLQKSENELLMGMHEKTRYSIRLAERKQITAEIITDNFGEYFEDFYQLMSDTAERNKFNLHPKQYYQNIFAGLNSKNAYLSVAKFSGKVLAIDLVIVFAGVANYVFGGSSADERNRMPTYLAQWRAMCHAKQIGCEFYSLGAISDESDSYKGWDGITAFKKKFGGQEIRHSEFFDVVTSRFWYYIYIVRRFVKSLM